LSPAPSKKAQDGPGLTNCLKGHPALLFLFEDKITTAL